MFCYFFFVCVFSFSIGTNNRNGLKERLFGNLNNNDKHKPPLLCPNDVHVQFVTIGHNDYKVKIKQLLSLVKNDAFRGKNIVRRPIDELIPKRKNAQQILDAAIRAESKAWEDLRKAESRLNQARLTSNQ